MSGELKVLVNELMEEFLGDAHDILDSQGYVLEKDYTLKDALALAGHLAALYAGLSRG